MTVFTCVICLHTYDVDYQDAELAQPTCQDCANAYSEYLQ
jgi:hypothetical protein